MHAKRLCAEESADRSAVDKMSAEDFREMKPNKLKLTAVSTRKHSSISGAGFLLALVRLAFGIHPLPPAELGADEIAAKASATRGGAFGPALGMN